MAGHKDVQVAGFLRYVKPFLVVKLFLGERIVLYTLVSKRKFYNIVLHFAQEILHFIPTVLCLPPGAWAGTVSAICGSQACPNSQLCNLFSKCIEV